MEKYSHTKTKKDLKINTENSNFIGVRNSCYRELFVLVLSADAKIEDIMSHKDEEGVFNGNISFTISLERLNLSIQKMYYYKKEITSNFFASLIGELLVRENVEQFVSLMGDVDSEEYLDTCNKKHEKFGMKIQNGKEFLFTFHVSLLKTIIAEEFKINIV